MEDMLKKYSAYLDSLIESDSGELFTNGGREYASLLMSRLFEKTQKDARIYCTGFRPDLICMEDYWSALKAYLQDANKTLKVLVEKNDYMHEEPIKLLKSIHQSRKDDSIDLRLIQEEDRNEISKKLNDSDCNFAVFDGKMFRFEYDPEGFKAFGSFNDPKKSEVLKSIFDTAFDRAMPLFQN